MFWATLALIAAALMFGGASRGNAPQTALIELLSLPAIFLGLANLRAQERLRALRLPLIFLTAVLALPLLQLIPLPIGLWGALPGREGLASALTTLGPAPKVLSFSMAPDQTFGDFLWLLIPTGVFLGALACTGRQRRLLALAVVAAAVLSAGIGILQQAGMADRLQFYEASNIERPIGLFANRNHHALFLLLALPLLAAWLRERRAPHWQALLAFGVLATTVVALIVVTHSRAGLALSAIAVVGALAVLFRGRALSGAAIAGAAAVLALTVLTAGALFFNSAGLTNRFTTQLAGDERQTIWKGASEMAGSFAPLGSGLGSFVEVYPAAERPGTVRETFVNHAHNDYLELWLETGILGLALALFLLGWIALRTFAAWRGGAGEAMARGAGLAALLVALHSLVDYPARTPAVAATLALCCVFLALPRGEKTK